MPRRSVRNSSLLPCLLATAALLTAWPLQAATFTVNSTQHGTDANAATTTLVEAIQQANLAGGSNVIELAANGLYLSDDTVFIDGTSAGRTMYPAITSNITIRANGATLEATGKNARFFYISGSGALTLEDINLVGGRAKGGDGAGGNFMGGGGGAGMGGAIFVNGTTASLTMRRAAIFNCVAQGGAGTSSVNIGGPGGGGGGMGGDAGNLNTASAQSGGGGPRSAAPGATGGDGVGGNAGANNGGFGGGGGGGISGAAGNGGFGGGGGGGWQSGGSGGTPGTGGFGGGGGGIFSGTGAAGGTFGGQGGAYNGSGYGTGGGGAGLGGAIFNYQGVVTLENVSLLSNSAKGGAGSALNGIGAGSGVGGGIFNYDGSVTLKHVTAYTNTVSTFTPNPGQATGGALYNYDAPGGATPSATIYNSILANSTFTNATGVEVAGSGTLVAAGAANSSIITSSSGLTGTVRTASPQLALIERKSGLYLFRPTPGSPAIDNGDGSNSLATDSSGTARPQGSGVDIGAAEGAFSTTINLTTGMLLVTDTQADAVFAIDPATGNRTLVSRLNYVGTGPDIGNPRGIALDGNRNIYVVNTSPVVAIVKIDPTTGNRTTVSSSASAPAVGTGPAFGSPSGITIRPSDGMLLVSDTGGPNGGAGGDAIFVVDPVTGNRTILSDDVTPDAVNALTTANTIIYHSTLGILVADNTGVDTVTRVNGTTGARTIFSSSTVPNATNPFTNPFGLAEESDGSILLVESNATVSANRQLLRLDKTTGARTVVSNLATTGSFQGLAVSPNGIYVTMTTTPMQIWSVDASTGAVATVAGNSIGDGVLFGGSTGSIGFNIGLAVVPGSASTAPTVTTPTSASVTTTAATLGGDVTSEGSAAVTVRGVVYAAAATNATPALGGTGVINLTGTGTTGIFTVSATGLTPGTSYSYRAYATNSVGTAYSSTGTFTTTADTTSPTVVSVVRTTPAQQGIGPGGSVTFTVTFSEPVTGVTTDRFAVHNITGGTVTGTVSGVSEVSSSVYDVTVTLTGGSGEFTLRVEGAEIP